MTPALLIIIFAVVFTTCLAMLASTGALRELFSRFSTTATIQDDSQTLSEAPSEWIENHEFWGLGDIEEVAF